MVSTGPGEVGSAGRTGGSGAAVDSTTMGMVAAGSAQATRSNVNRAGTAQESQRSKSQVLQLVPFEMTKSHMSQACSRLKVRNLHMCPAGHTVPLKSSSAMLWEARSYEDLERGTDVKRGDDMGYVYNVICLMFMGLWCCICICT
jgi:hypothetical protein